MCLVYGLQIKSLGKGGHNSESDIHHNYPDAKAGGFTSVQGEMLPVVNLNALPFFLRGLVTKSVGSKILS